MTTPRIVVFALLVGCGARPTLSGGMPGAVVPIHDAPDKTALCIGAANRCLLLGCGCGITARCTETPEELWCITRARSCPDVEACLE